MKFLFRIRIVLVSLVVLMFFSASDPIIKFEKKYDIIDMDVLGNLVLAKAHEIDKYNSKGKLLQHYSNLSNGDIYDLDASDALHVLVFYQDFQKLLFLDSDLAPKGDWIDLNELEFPEASLVCTSFDGGFWMYDSQSSELLRINNALKTDQKRANIHFGLFFV